MRPIITELDNNKKGSIRTDVADLVLVKYVLIINYLLWKLIKTSGTIINIYSVVVTTILAYRKT